MQYLLLIYDNEQRWAAGYDPAELAKYREFGQEFAAAIKGGNALQPTNTANTVRVRDGKLVMTDGPFAETKEQLGGYYILECKDLDEAIHWASQLPAAPKGGTGCVEIRPILDVAELEKQINQAAGQGAV